MTKSLLTPEDIKLFISECIRDNMNNRYQVMNFKELAIYLNLPLARILSFKKCGMPYYIKKHVCYVDLKLLKHWLIEKGLYDNLGVKI